jgi:D-alanine-D-alanine ligase
MTLSAQRPRSVLILHNRPRLLSGEGGARFSESDAGVLHEVAAVAKALDAIGIPHRTGGVLRLDEVGAVVSAGSEEAVFNLVESLEGERWDFCMVPAVCRALGRAVTGCGAASQTLTLDKWVTKSVLLSHGIPTPRAAVVPQGAGLVAAEIPGGDLIVKPVSTDASEGIDAASVVRTADRGRLLEAVSRVHDTLGQPALVEQYIEGREFNVSVLESGGRATVMPVAEIEFVGFPSDKPRIVDYTAKWIEDSFEYRNTQRRVPADLPEKTASEIARWALAAWRALHCSDYARVDFRLDERLQPYVLEINANPDISPDAGFSAALTAGRVSFDAFVEKVLANAMARRHS